MKTVCDGDRVGASSPAFLYSRIFPPNDGGENSSIIVFPPNDRGENSIIVDNAADKRILVRRSCAIGK